jgi:hypothetical protein
VDDSRLLKDVLELLVPLEILAQIQTKVLVEQGNLKG